MAAAINRRLEELEQLRVCVQIPNSNILPLGMVYR